MTNRQPTERGHRWIARIGLSLLLLLGCADTRAVIDAWSYQIPMAPAPQTVSEAIATLPARSSTVIGVMACGNEFDFIGRFLKQDNSEDIAVEILGKVAWTQRALHYTTGVATFSQPCEIKVAVAHWQVCKVFDANCRSDDDATRKAAEDAFLKNPAWIALTNWPSSGVYTPDVKPLRDQILSVLPAGCANDADGKERYSVTASTPSTAAPPDVRLTFKIATVCLMAQANAALLQMSRGKKQVGTTGAPCHIFGGTDGDWDPTLKDLIRIAELDRQTPAL